MAIFFTSKYFGTRADGGFAVCDLSKPITLQDIPAGALKQYNRMFHKAKYFADGRIKKISARCYTDGSH